MSFENLTLVDRHNSFKGNLDYIGYYNMEIFWEETKK